MTATDVGGTGAQNGRICALGTTGAKFQNGSALSRPDNSVGLGGNEALMVNTQQKIRLNELGLNGRSANGNDGFIGEHGCSFRNRPDVSGKTEISQILQEFLTEEVSAPEIVNILLRKMQILNVLDDLLQTGSNGKTTAIGTAPEKQIKISNAVCIARGKIALTHGQLIKIAEHG